MVQRERVTEDIIVFHSDLYAQVTASLVQTSEGLVLIDTLLYPEETLQIKRFAETRLRTSVQYVINTHHHADHTVGTCFFEDAVVISHEKCRQLLDTRGRESLANMQDGASDMSDLHVVMPHIVFDDRLSMTIGNKTFHMVHSPGHSDDSITVWVEEDNVLFAADTVMPIPYFVDGSYDDFVQSLQRLKGRSFENIVQGHGEIVLRGEMQQKIESDLSYLYKLQLAVDKVLTSSEDADEIAQSLAKIKITACGKSHILLNGLVEHLHRQNVLALAEQRQKSLIHEK